MARFGLQRADSGGKGIDISSLEEVTDFTNSDKFLVYNPTEDQNSALNGEWLKAVILRGVRRRGPATNVFSAATYAAALNAATAYGFTDGSQYSGRPQSFDATWLDAYSASDLLIIQATQTDDPAGSQNYFLKLTKAAFLNATRFDFGSGSTPTLTFGSTADRNAAVAAFGGLTAQERAVIEWQGHRAVIASMTSAGDAGSNAFLARMTFQAPGNGWTNLGNSSRPFTLQKWTADWMQVGESQSETTFHVNDLDAITSLQLNDALAVSDTSDSNKTVKITIANARKLLKSSRGLWNTLSGQRLYVGDVVQHGTRWYIVTVEHNRGVNGPDLDTNRFILITEYNGDWRSGWFSKGSFVTHANEGYFANVNVVGTDPAPNASNNVKWKRFTNLTAGEIEDAIAGLTGDDRLDLSALKGAVSTAQIANSAVTEAKLAADVTTKLNASSPTGAQIADLLEALTGNDRLLITSLRGNIAATQIADRSIQSTKIAANSIGKGELGNNNIIDPGMLDSGDNTKRAAFRTAIGAGDGNYNNLANLPTLAPSNAEQNVQVDWNETDTRSDAFIKNKPSSISGGGSGAKNLVETLSDNTTFSLEDKWDEWKGNNVFFRVEGETTYTATINGGNWEPSILGEGETVIPPNSVLFASTSTLVSARQAIEYNDNKSLRPRITDASLTRPDQTVYFDTLWINRDGTIELRFASDRSEESSAANDRLSDNWEKSGQLIVTMNDGSDPLDVLTVNLTGADLTEPYLLSNLPNAAAVTAYYNRISGLGQTGFQNANPKITFRANVANPAERGQTIVFHSLYDKGRIEGTNMAFARHDSDGRVTSFVSSATGRNLTEGLGEPFRLVFAGNYQDGKVQSPWHVSPLTQDVRGVLNLYDHTVAHQVDIDGIESKIDHLISQDSETVAYWQTFTLDPVGGSVQRSFWRYAHRTVGDVKITGKEGETEIFLETTIGGVTTKKSIGQIADELNIGTQYVDFRLEVFVMPEYATNGNLNGAQLSFRVNSVSRSLVTHIPADFELTPTPTRTSGGVKTFDNLIHIAGETGSVTGVELTNRFIGGNDGIAGAWKLRLFGTEASIDKLREVVKDDLGNDDRARVGVYDVFQRQWIDLPITAFSTTAIGQGFNKAFHSADITVPAQSIVEGIMPSPGNYMRFYLKSLDIPDWVVNEDERVPTSKFPIAGAGNPLGDKIATGENIVIPAGTNDNEVMTPSWTVPNTFVASYSQGSSDNEILSIKAVRRTQAVVGFIVRLLDTADDSVVAELMQSFESPNNVRRSRFALEGSIGADLRVARAAEGTTDGLTVSVKPSGTSTRASAHTYRVEIHEWIDSAFASSTNEGAAGTQSGIGSSGSFLVLRRQENVEVTLSGTSTDIGPYTVDATATHLDIKFTAPANLALANVTLLYKDADDVWRNLYRFAGEGQASSLLTLSPSQVRTYRFSDIFQDSQRRIHLRATAGSTMTGTLNLTLVHETDVDSAQVEPRTLLNVPVTIPSQALSANLTGAVWTEVGLDVPVEWDLIDHLNIAMRVLDSADIPNEDADIVLSLSKDRMDWVGFNPGSLPNARPIKGWYAKGWGANGHANSVNAWSDRPSASYVHYYASQDTVVPNRIIGLKREGVYLTDILVATFHQQCKITHVSCMRKI